MSKDCCVPVYAVVTQNNNYIHLCARGQNKSKKFFLVYLWSSSRGFSQSRFTLLLLCSMTLTLSEINNVQPKAISSALEQQF